MNPSKLSVVEATRVLVLLIATLWFSGANADLIRLDATSLNLDLVSDFTIIFDDTGDGLLQWEEIVNFSGITACCTSSAPGVFDVLIHYDILIGISSIYGVSTWSYDPNSPFTQDPPNPIYPGFCNDPSAVGWCIEDSTNPANSWSGYYEFHWVYDLNYANESTSVPEPGTLALLGIGLAGMGLTRRRKRTA